MASGPGLSIGLVSQHFAKTAAPLFGPLTLTVARGEVLAVIGPSGVGKTTLLRMIAGLESGFQGHILIDGLPPDKAAPPGFVFQDTRLLPWLNVAANLRAVRPAMTPAKIETLLKRVGLSGLSGAFPHQLSGGMARRLGLARAICVNPGLLLLDEPFVSLDRAAVHDLRLLCQSIFAADRPTVVLVSHDPADAAFLADRVIILGDRPARIAADIPLSPGAMQRSPSEVDRLAGLILAAQTGIAAPVP